MSPSSQPPSPRPKFSIGQVVMMKRGLKKRDVALKILEVIFNCGEHFYRVDRKNFLAEHMLREMSADEKGDTA